MSKRKSCCLRVWLPGLSLAVLLATSLACGAGATATPVRAPTVAPAPTAAPAPTRAPAVAPTATPAPVAAKERPQRGGTIRFPLSISIDAPDPAYTTLAGTRIVLYLVYNNLVELSPDSTITPELARSWEISPDGKSVTFKLQSGVKFHDDTVLDAQAVKWNYDRFLDPAVGAPRRTELSPPLQRVEVVDGSTVRFQLANPFRPLLAVLTLQGGSITSPTAVQKYNSYADRNGEFGRKPVGSGPFKLQEWVAGSHFSLVRNDGYWEQGLPYLDAIKMPIIGDKQIQFAMLRTGEVDVMDEVRPEDIEIMLKNPNLRADELKGSGTEIIHFRISVKPWDNKALRQAFAYAVDRKTIADVVWGAGGAVAAQSVIGPSTGKWYDASLQIYDYSPQKARQKLAEAGYPGGFSFKAPCRTSGKDAQACEAVQAMLVNSGINMEIQPYENVAYFADFTTRKHNGPMITSWFPRPDPGVLIRLLYHTKGSQNTIDYSNLEVDKLIEEADGVYDLAKAKEMYRTALTKIAEDAPHVYLAWYNVFYGLRDNVHDFAPPPDRVVRLRDMWLSK